MRRIAISLLLPAGLLAGCTSLQTVPDNFRTGDRGEALQGFPYSLPMRQFDLEAAWTLTDCANRPPADVNDTPTTVITPNLEAEPLLSAGERYLVDYRALASWIKTSDFSIENHPEGTLKSINAAADDRTAEVATSVVKTGFSVATLAAGGLPVRGPASIDDPDKIVESGPKLVKCTKPALDALVRVKAAKSKLKRLTGELRELNKRVEELALAGMLDGTKRSALAAQLQAMRQKSGELDEAKEALSETLKPLRLTRKVRWPGDFSEGGGTAVPLTPGPLPENTLPESWTGLFVAVDNSLDRGSGNCLVALEGELAPCLQAQTVTFVRLEPAFALSAKCDQNPQAFACRREPVTELPDPLGQEYTPEQRADYRAAKALYRLTNPVKARDRNPDEGIFVRPPELGRLVACKNDSACDPASEDAIKVGDWIAVPQLGQLRFLPFRNRAFENNALVLVLGKDGTVEKFQYASKAAMLERLAGAAASSGEAGLAGRKSYREQRTARRAEQLAELNHRVALDETRDKVAALDAPAADTAEEAVEDAEQVQRISLKLELEVEDSAIAQIRID